jgi:hypothetical protein
VEADQKRLEDLLGQVKYQKDIESKGLDNVLTSSPIAFFNCINSSINAFADF